LGDGRHHRDDLIATAISLNDVRAWTLVAAVAIGYMLSRGLAKSGSKYAGDEDPAQPRQPLGESS